MFEVYNAVVRGMGNRGAVPFGVFAQQSVVDEAGLPRFAHSVHTITSGIKRLNFSLPSREIYRGLAEMKMPQQFQQVDERGFRTGADYGFQSFSLDRAVALNYSTLKGSACASTLIVTRTDMSNRGAFIAFLSQYPHEREVLLPPLTGIEAR